MSKNTIVLLKFGALGDVVRTSYFAEALAQKSDSEILWVTSKSSADIIRFNPFVTKVITDLNSVPNSANTVISLDDEQSSAEIASNINSEYFIGAYYNNGIVCYTDNSSDWFDMGLVSKYGKKRADELKKSNLLSHTQIFNKILGVSVNKPNFYGNEYLDKFYKSNLCGSDFVLGVNPFSGTRWPSKEMPTSELYILLSSIHELFVGMKYKNHKILLYCDNFNMPRALQIKSRLPFISIINTDYSIHHFASAIAACDYLISADTLGLHLAIARGIPTLSYYAPTSAVEIDTFGTGIKVASTSEDYCSYAPNVDNSTLTASRLFESFHSHIESLGYGI